jgi:hypothetical protein
MKDERRTRPSRRLREMLGATRQGLDASLLRDRRRAGGLAGVDMVVATPT